CPALRPETDGRMTRASRYARAAALLIVALLPACDNVSWGGADIAVVPPPPQATASPDTLSPDAPVNERMPSGPVLFHVIRDSATATMIPVAEVSGDSLLPVRAKGDRKSTRLNSSHVKNSYAVSCLTKQTYNQNK